MKPLFSAVLSFLMPGLGQFHNGQLWKGIIFYLLYLILFFILHFLNLFQTFNGLIVVFIIGIGLYLFIIADALYFALKSSVQKLMFQKKWPIFVLLILLHIIISSHYKNYINSNFITAHKVKTSSMEPTLIAGDYFIADYNYYKSNSVKLNDIVVIRFPKDPEQKFIERCIAIGGQVIEIKDKAVFINGSLFPDSQKTQFIDSNIMSKGINDPEIDHRATGNRDNYGPITVPRDHCFVLGDNLDNSYDSRYWGFVPIENVIAKPLYIYWSKDKSRLGRHIN